jgi:type I restriction enzyme R subunit
MASIMPYEVLEWEKLFWFMKFLIPKLVVITKEDQLIDELLESVDLSTYGLERTKLNHSIGLDDSPERLLLGYLFFVGSSTIGFSLNRA